jgi:hypothetical protein
MHLADHRVAGDAAELAGDLARRQSIRPQLLEELDALLGPAHVFPLAGEIHRFVLLLIIVRSNELPGRIPPRCRRTPGSPDY